MGGSLTTMPTTRESIPPAGYKTQSEDTDYEIERRLFEAYRRMPPWEKAVRVGEMVMALDQTACPIDSGETCSA